MNPHGPQAAGDRSADPGAFDSDVFVSYAHIDDQPLTEGDKGWISSLHRALEVRLGQLLGTQPRIWRDPKLGGNDYFGDEIVERLPRVALLLSVLSPRYVRSDWCTRELREFWRATERTGGVRIANKSRVFKVVKTPVPLAEHPSELQQVLGYDFFAVEPDSGRPRELSPGAAPELQRQYWAKLDDLAHDIAELLRALGRQAVAASSGAAAGAARGFVYLAETSFDLKEKREAVRREIQGRGFEVLPDRPLPLIGPECEALVREQLARCSLSIHLVGQNYGIVPEGATESLVALQNDLAAERAAAGGPGGLSRLLWLPTGLEPTDERQRRFVARLTTDALGQQGSDLLETTFEDFKLALGQRLEPPPGPEPARAAAAASAGDAPPRIYLICDQRDVDASAAVADHLFEAGFEVITPVFDGDEAQVRRDHEESLVLCDAALVYYGAASELWLRQKLREIMKSSGQGRTRPLAAKAVYVAPPVTPQKARFRTHEALVLAENGHFDPAALAPFLTPLGGRTP